VTLAAFDGLRFLKQELLVSSRFSNLENREKKRIYWQESPNSPCIYYSAFQLSRFLLHFMDLGGEEWGEDMYQAFF
jgi:hypothetical protein